MSKFRKLLKIDTVDYQEIKEKANEFTGGNITQWIIYASLVHVPSDHELVVVVEE